MRHIDTSTSLVLSTSPFFLNMLVLFEVPYKCMLSTLKHTSLSHVEDVARVLLSVARVLLDAQTDFTNKQVFERRMTRFSVMFLN